MRPEVITFDDKAGYKPFVRRAAAALRSGALVVFPTETVYGLGACALEVAAVRRLREVKGSPAARAFTVHIARREDAADYVSTPAPVAVRLARKTWPGPLTLICTVSDPAGEVIGRKCSPEQLKEIYHERKVGLRCPDHEVARDLLLETAAPVVASSANKAGAPPPLELSAALDALDEQVDYAIDGGPTRHNAASTIVEIDVNGGWRIVRTGVIDERTIRRMARREVVMVCTGNSCRSPLAEYMFREKLATRLGVTPAQLEGLGYTICSAGTAAAAGWPISEGSLVELRRRGIDARMHRSTPLTEDLIRRADRIYTMSPEHRAAVVQMVPSARDRVVPLDAQGPIADPIGGDQEAYRRCAGQIEQAVDQRLEEFVNEDRNW